VVNVLNQNISFKTFFGRLRKTTEDRFIIIFILFISIYISRILVIAIVHDQVLSYRNIVSEGHRIFTENNHKSKQNERQYKQGNPLT